MTTGDVQSEQPVYAVSLQALHDAGVKTFDVESSDLSDKNKSKLFASMLKTKTELIFAKQKARRWLRDLSSILFLLVVVVGGYIAYQKFDVVWFDFSNDEVKPVWVHERYWGLSVTREPIERIELENVKPIWVHTSKKGVKTPLATSYRSGDSEK